MWVHTLLCVLVPHEYVQRLVKVSHHPALSITLCPLPLIRDFFLNPEVSHAPRDLPVCTSPSDDGSRSHGHTLAYTVSTPTH